jgi:hypothetical protein
LSHESTTEGQGKQDPVDARDVGEWLQDQEVRMRILVWKGDAGDAGPWLLRDGLPLVANQDYVQIECEVPAGKQLDLVWLDAEGNWYHLDPVADPERSSQSAVSSDTPARYYWPNAQEGGAVEGMGGTEAIFALVSERNVTKQEQPVSSPTKLPSLEPNHLIVVTRQDVRSLTTRGPGDARRATQVAPVEAIRKSFANRFDRVVGVVFTLTQ